MSEYILHPSSELAWVDLFNEWQRVAVDHAPVDHGFADLLYKVAKEEIVATVLDAFPTITDPTRIHVWMRKTNLDQTPPTMYLDDAEGWRS